MKSTKNLIQKVLTLTFFILMTFVCVIPIYAATFLDGTYTGGGSSGGSNQGVAVRINEAANGYNCGTGYRMYLVDNEGNIQFDVKDITFFDNNDPDTTKLYKTRSFNGKPTVQSIGSRQALSTKATGFQFQGKPDDDTPVLMFNAYADGSGGGENLKLWLQEKYNVDGEEVTNLDLVYKWLYGEEQYKNIESDWNLVIEGTMRMAMWTPVFAAEHSVATAETHHCLLLVQESKINGKKIKVDLCCESPDGQALSRTETETEIIFYKKFIPSISESTNPQCIAIISEYDRLLTNTIALETDSELKTYIRGGSAGIDKYSIPEIGNLCKYRAKKLGISGGYPYTTTISSTGTLSEVRQVQTANYCNPSTYKGPISGTTASGKVVELSTAMEYEDETYLGINNKSCGAHGFFLEGIDINKYHYYTFNMGFVYGTFNNLIDYIYNNVPCNFADCTKFSDEYYYTNGLIQKLSSGLIINTTISTDEGLKLDAVTSQETDISGGFKLLNSENDCGNNKNKLQTCGYGIHHVNAENITKRENHINTYNIDINPNYPDYSQSSDTTKNTSGKSNIVKVYYDYYQGKKNSADENKRFEHKGTFGTADTSENVTITDEGRLTGYTLRKYVITKSYKSDYEVDLDESTNKLQDINTKFTGSGDISKTVESFVDIFSSFEVNGIQEVNQGSEKLEENETIYLLYIKTIEPDAVHTTVNDTTPSPSEQPSNNNTYDCSTIENLGCADKGVGNYGEMNIVKYYITKYKYNVYYKDKSTILLSGAMKSIDNRYVVEESSSKITINKNEDNGYKLKNYMVTSKESIDSNETTDKSLSIVDEILLGSEENTQGSETIDGCARISFFPFSLEDGSNVNGRDTIQALGLESRYDINGNKAKTLYLVYEREGEDSVTILDKGDDDNKGKVSICVGEYSNYNYTVENSGQNEYINGSNDLKLDENANVTYSLKKNYVDIPKSIVVKGDTYKLFEYRYVVTPGDNVNTKYSAAEWCKKTPDNTGQNSEDECSYKESTDEVTYNNFNRTEFIGGYNYFKDSIIKAQTGATIVNSTANDDKTIRVLMPESDWKVGQTPILYVLYLKEKHATYKEETATLTESHITQLFSYSKLAPELDETSNGVYKKNPIYKHFFRVKVDKLDDFLSWTDSKYEFAAQHFEIDSTKNEFRTMAATGNRGIAWDKNGETDIHRPILSEVTKFNSTGYSRWINEHSLSNSIKNNASVVHFSGYDFCFVGTRYGDSLNIPNYKVISRTGSTSTASSAVFEKITSTNSGLTYVPTGDADPNFVNYAQLVADANGKSNTDLVLNNTVSGRLTNTSLNSQTLPSNTFLVRIRTTDCKAGYSDDASNKLDHTIKYKDSSGREKDASANIKYDENTTIRLTQTVNYKVYAGVETSTENDKIANNQGSSELEKVTILSGQTRASGLRIPTAKISFVPYIRMQYDVLGTVDNQVPVQGKFIRSISPYNYIGTSYTMNENNKNLVNTLSDDKQKGKIKISSNQWSTHAQAINDAKFASTVLPGGSTFTLSTPKEYRQIVTVEFLGALLEGTAKDQATTIAGEGTRSGNYDTYWDTDLVTKYKSYVKSVSDDVIKTLDELNIEQYYYKNKKFEDTGSKKANEEGKFSNPVYSLVGVINTNDMLKKANNVEDLKYYIRPQETVDSSHPEDKSSINIGDMDASYGDKSEIGKKAADESSATSIKYYTFFTTTNGSIWVAITKDSTKKGKIVNEFEQGEKALKEGEIDGIEYKKLLTKTQNSDNLSSEWKIFNKKVGIIDKLIAAVERNTGNDKTASWASSDGTWYNEAFDGITYVEIKKTIVVGYESPAERTAVLDPALTPKSTGKGDMFTAYNLSQFTTKAYSDRFGFGDTSLSNDGYSQLTNLEIDNPFTNNGSKLSIKLGMYHMNELFISDIFYIPNVTVQDLK